MILAFSCDLNNIRVFIPSFFTFKLQSFLRPFYFCSTCRPFGRIEQTDIKRRPDHNDAFAFVVFDDISDSIKAVKTLGSSTDINGIEVKIGYSTSSKVRTIILIFHVLFDYVLLLLLLSYVYFLMFFMS